jgi:hypothetical protein
MTDNKRNEELSKGMGKKYILRNTNGMFAWK